MSASNKSVAAAKRRILYELDSQKTERSERLLKVWFKQPEA